MKDRLKLEQPSARELIATNIRILRAELGMSQEGLAVTAGFHRTYLSQLERCTANISADGLDKLAQALGVPVRRLFDPNP